MCFIDSGHLLIQLLVPPLVFVDAHRQGRRVPEETVGEREMRERERGFGGSEGFYKKKESLSAVFKCQPGNLCIPGQRKSIWPWFM